MNIADIPEAGLPTPLSGRGTYHLVPGLPPLLSFCFPLFPPASSRPGLPTGLLWRSRPLSLLACCGFAGLFVGLAGCLCCATTIASDIHGESLPYFQFHTSSFMPTALLPQALRCRALFGFTNCGEPLIMSVCVCVCAWVCVWVCVCV